MKKKIFTASAVMLLLLQLNAQDKNKNGQEGYRFTPVVELKATSVKDQASTSTCWSFSTISFIESELLRTGKGEYDLSEMWIVRSNYIDRLKDNFRKQGKGNLGEGGLAHDVMIRWAETGMVPDEVYTGLNYSMPRHNHGELNSLIKAVGGVSVEKRKESDQYFGVVNSILDTYLGKAPESFTYKGVGYTPKSFAKSLGINPDDYIEITSFAFIPFYKQGLVEIPDNWRKINFYNVPLDDMITIIDNALNTGYTVEWDGDISEDFFSGRNSVAIIPELENTSSYNASDKKRFGNMTKEERSAEALRFNSPFPAKTITQEIRDRGFEDKTTTDDHGMHLTGISKDQAGNKYYITKNSWGPASNKTGGYLNMSENYVRAKTIFVMVHKDAIPKDIRTKLGF